MIIPAVLGWANIEDPNLSHRLYALDAGPSPRWLNRPYGRTIETAISTGGAEPVYEGDRFLVVRLGDRFIDDEKAAALTVKIQELIEEELE
jgi:hypothetical protein